ncbi:hypothetical protein Tco_1042448 [Tanacetum coccineum]|uniref:Uncharacterized protein n=1 Tax=Tanacetum coccineum TaxID=301880 RepID=A0ABQ5GJQ9_9ASTR
MENANPPPTSNRPVLPAALRVQAVQELHELQRISVFVDSRLEREVLNELIGYENVGMLRRERAINSFDRDDMAFQCMIGFRNFVTYSDPFLPMNIITRKAYNTILVEGLESIGKNLVAVFRDVHMKFLSKNEEEFFTVPGDGVGIKPDGVASSAIVEVLSIYISHGRKAHLIEDKQIPSVGVFDEVTWMAFGGNTRDLGSFGEETDKITDLHQILEEVLFTESRDGVAGIKRRRRDLSSNGVRDLATASGRGRFKEDLESST